jgi:starch phosphorylase
MAKKIADYTDKPLAACTDLELFNAVLNLTADAAKENGYNEGKKKLYYISAEFLIGKLLSNNLINLGLYEQVKQELAEAGKDITTLEEFENEPSLGNGGLGRLAACFIDSLATLGLPASGVGLAYHCGLFKQSFDNNKQYESPDYWLRWGQESWMRRTPKHYTVNFGDLSVTSTMYQLDVTGYHSKCDTLNLFDVDTVDERIIRNRINFDKTQVAKNLTLFLYPDDSDEAGRVLRVYQEYFMVSNAAQLMLDECVERGSNLHDLADYAAVQINDTHPTMVIPELMRLLGRAGLRASTRPSQIVRACCAYTNHTILAEALESWPLESLQKAVPQLRPGSSRQLDELTSPRSTTSRSCRSSTRTSVHMANIDIHFSHSSTAWPRCTPRSSRTPSCTRSTRSIPEKFNNKTNGITFRRWIMECNPALSGCQLARSARAGSTA